MRRDYAIHSNEKRYAYDSDIGYVNRDWMSKILDEKKISESIPGTHGQLHYMGQVVLMKTGQEIKE
ncbi:hypothetical protein U0X36_05755 [Bacillus thuringiensis]|uniref:hypothetical protein n=1 Tax=Bacillus thuringiensis TaxID=1428 RepID=UPI000E49E4BD|nr:hypothetical protein [Bacillus thuringiensis]MDZ3952445.1 hypothetical protein [Bacillus thuringiensis]